MAIKANVSFTQKLGQPDYGSVGAGCTLEIELDASLLERDLDEVRGQLDRLGIILDDTPEGTVWKRK